MCNNVVQSLSATVLATASSATVATVSPSTTTAAPYIPYRSMLIHIPVLLCVCACLICLIFAVVLVSWNTRCDRDFASSGSTWCECGLHSQCRFKCPMSTPLALSCHTSSFLYLFMQHTCGHWIHLQSICICNFFFRFSRSWLFNQYAFGK